jgi:GWxTD domain-containing protein
MPIGIIAGTLTKPCYFHTRMRYVFLLTILSLTASGQALRDINYNFRYNPSEPLEFQLHAVKGAGNWTAYYTLIIRDSVEDVNQFSIQWEVRKDLSEKEGLVIDTEATTVRRSKNTIAGSVIVTASTERQYLMAKVVNTNVKRAWIFYEALEPNIPVNGYVAINGTPVTRPFIKVNTPVSLVMDETQKIISYYNDNFPAAVPGFSEGMGRVAKSMVVDSTFAFSSNDPISFTQPGLYLIQSDTNAAKGFAFRVEDDYPRLSKIESLADPLIYVCTKQEFDRMKQAKGDKKAFDRVVLSITQDTERARKFMRSYFRRVELANEFFTSYKEGWKTDRGMIYIVFGLPDQVYKFTDREVWTYKNNLYKISFDFVKSSTLFDPENFVLVREKKFQETWYEVIDLWRNARF